MLPWHPEFSCMKLLVRDDSRRKEEFHAAFDLAWDSCVIACCRGNYGRTDHHLVCRRRTGRCYCMLCRSEPHCTDIAVSVCFIGTSHLYQTTGNEVLQETIQTNANSLIGKKAVVIQEIDNLAQTGQVRINDIEWTARSADDEKIGEGTVVTIEEIRGVKLIVKQNKED